MASKCSLSTTRRRLGTRQARQRPIPCGARGGAEQRWHTMHRAGRGGKAPSGRTLVAHGTDNAATLTAASVNASPDRQTRPSWRRGCWRSVKLSRGDASTATRAKASWSEGQVVKRVGRTVSSSRFGASRVSARGPGDNALCEKRTSSQRRLSFESTTSSDIMSMPRSCSADRGAYTLCGDPIALDGIIESSFHWTWGLVRQTAATLPLFRGTKCSPRSPPVITKKMETSVKGVQTQPP
mmetsp:Transcript_31817/g.84985  ORF Transcript_31817/g.84985 Transcript_31817/m.84985 type:complete len:239 (-) Transcript_31817:43-759(-)